MEKEEPVMAEFGGSVTESKARVFSTAPSNLFPQKRISPPPTPLSHPKNLTSAAPHPSLSLSVGGSVSVAFHFLFYTFRSYQDEINRINQNISSSLKKKREKKKRGREKITTNLSNKRKLYRRGIIHSSGYKPDFIIPKSISRVFIISSLTFSLPPPPPSHRIPSKTPLPPYPPTSNPLALLSLLFPVRTTLLPVSSQWSDQLTSRLADRRPHQ